MYSWGHETLDAAKDDDYWRFSFAEMGEFDDIANVKMVKEEADVDKIVYVGYS
jgi:hypothetical protein